MKTTNLLLLALALNTAFCASMTAMESTSNRQGDEEESVENEPAEKRQKKEKELAISELNVTINIDDPEETEKLCKRVAEELNQYVAKNQHLDRFFKEDNALLLAFNLGDKTFLKQYLPVMQQLGMIDPQNTLASRLISWNLYVDLDMDEILSFVLKYGCKFKNDSQDVRAIHVFINNERLLAAKRLLNNLACKTIMDAYNDAENLLDPYKVQVQSFIREHHQCEQCFPKE